MFSFLTPNKAEPPPQPDGPPVSMLLLGQKEFPVREAVERMRSLPFAAEMSEVNQGEDGTTLAFNIGHDVVAVSNMGVPYPDDLTGVYPYSWMFPDAAEVLPGHQSFLQLAVVDNPADPIPGVSLLTRVTAALAKETGVIGIYWPDAMVVHRPKVFTEMTDKILKGNVYPLYLWINMYVWQNEDTTHSVITTGMDRFGKYELEILNVMVNPGGLREFIYGMADAFISGNPPMHDGVEVGTFSGRKLRAYYKPSIIEGRGTVISMTT